MASWIKGSKDQLVNGMKIIQIDLSQTTLSYLIYVEVILLLSVSYWNQFVSQ
jgi:hypothetical protein